MELKVMIADEVEDRELAQKVVRYAMRSFLMEPEYSDEWVRELVEGYTSREEAEAASDEEISALSSSISETLVEMARELGLEDPASVSA